MRSVFNMDRQFQCIMNLACKMQRSNSPWHFKFVAKHREHKAHTNYDKTNVPVIVGTMCKSLRVHKSTYVPDLICDLYHLRNFLNIQCICSKVKL